MEIVIGFLILANCLHSTVSLSSGLSNQTGLLRITKNNNSDLHAAAETGSLEIYVSNCVSSNAWEWEGQTSVSNSKYTHYIVLSGCMRFYVDHECRGDFFVKRPGRDGRLLIKNRLSVVKSVGPCDDEYDDCLANNSTNATSKSIITFRSTTNGEPDRIELELDVKGCVQVPRFNRQVSWFELNELKCIELHLNLNCTGQTNRLIKYWSTYSVFLPALLNARAISPCGYNCVVRPKLEQTVDSPLPSGPGIVTIYEAPDFKGEYKHINISQGCQEVFDEYHWPENFQLWQSVRTYGQCVTLYERLGCLDSTTIHDDILQGDRTILLNQSNLHLHAHFNLRLKSVKHCNQTATNILYAITKSKDGLRQQLVNVSNCRTSTRMEYFDDPAFVEQTYGYNGCLNIYKEANCTGKYIVISPTRNSENFFWDVRHRDAGWLYRLADGLVGSIGPCKCDGRHQKNQKLFNSITLYSNSNATNRQGQSWNVQVTGCHVLPRKLQKTVTSIPSLSSNACFEFHENWDCTGRSFEFEANRQRQIVLDKLAKPLPSLWDYQAQLKGQIRSISLCRSECNVHQPLVQRPRISSRANFVTFFDELNFTGNFVEVNLTDGCVTVGEQFPEWDGQAKSVWTNNECVIVYSRTKCTAFRGSNYLILNESNVQKNHSNQYFPIRSIKQCQQESDKAFLITIQDKDELLDQCKTVGTKGLKLVQPSNIDPRYNCLNIFEAPDCIGRYIEWTTGKPPPNFFWDKLDLTNWVGSLSPCECDPRSKEVRYTRNDPTVVLYDTNLLEGKNVTIALKGCHLIPRTVHRTVQINIDFVNPEYSIHNTESNFEFDDVNKKDEDCVEFYEFWNCTGRSVQHGPGRRHPFVLVPDGSKNLFAGRDPHLLFKWTDSFSSVSSCTYRCRTKKSTESKSSSASLSSKVVRIFDERNFNGNLKELDLSQGCLNVGDEFNWEGEFKSIQLFKECVTMHSSVNCSITSENLSLNYSNSKAQAEYPMKWRVKSIKLCKEDISEQLQSTESTSSNSTLFAILLPISILFFITLAVVVFIHFRLRRRVREFLNEKEIQDFLNGNPNLGDGNNVMGQSQPYDQRFEIPKQLLDIDLGSPLGSGAFAVVYKGLVQHFAEDCKGVVVAVKTVKPYAGVEYTRALLKEIKTMIYVGDQERILQIIGCCTQQLRTGELYVMTELCVNGSMEYFLRTNRDNFVDLIIEKGPVYSNCFQMQVLSNSGDTEPISPSHFTTVHLMKWSLQIAEGMEHLASKKVVHGDLATRNVLLDVNFDTKISDFGLSRQLYQYSQYVKKTQSPLPWKWLAIETLRSQTFSTESDVWAFGVTIWEIFSLGDTPFPERTWNEEFVNDLTLQELRLTKPKAATTDWYALVQECWREKPSDRITFANLRTGLAKILHRNLPSVDDTYLNLADEELAIDC